MDLSASFTRALLDGFGAAYSQLLRAAARSTGSRDEARDLVHDTWLRLAEHAESAGPPGRHDEGEAPRDTTAYLAVMARHLALDAQRRARRQRALGEAATPRTEPAGPDVAETVMYRQAMAALDQALAGLPARSRAVFVAHRVNGETQPAIAARLGVSLNTVERDLMQAVDCIAAALQRWRGDRLDPPPRAGRRRGLAALLGAGGLSLVGALGWREWQALRDAQLTWQAAPATPRGRRARQALPDGSTLELDADSQVQLAFFRHRRQAQLLRGAAFFAVAPDRERPFEVLAGAVRVTVLGTRFGVERLPGGGVLVQVEEGQVRVEPGLSLPARELGAGEALHLLEDGSTRPAAAEAAPWRHGELVLADSTLGEALARLQRYTPYPLTASAPAAGLPVSGRLRIAQAHAWLDAVPLALPVRVQRQADGGLLFTRR